jgi:hypothetical protein
MMPTGRKENKLAVINAGYSQVKLYFFRRSVLISSPPHDALLDESLRASAPPQQWCAALFAAVLFLNWSACALEPWADQQLPVKDGLELWLSAGQENRARTFANARPTLPEGGPLDIWHDGSGHKRHVRQPADSFRPRLFQFPSPGVRFDGKDDFLSCAGLESTLKDATIFIRAALRSNAGGFRAFLAINQAGMNDFRADLTLISDPVRVGKLRR